MKVTFTVTLKGSEFAVNENLENLLAVVQPTIVDDCYISIRTVSEEDLRK